MYEKILAFISHFQKPDTIEVFTTDMCYWFAVIVWSRFGGEIMYTQVPGHFVCRCGGRLYDVTGDVTNEYSNMAMSLEEIRDYDDVLYKRLLRDCIMRV